jgi:hypothetical protein
LYACIIPTPAAEVLLFKSWTIPQNRYGHRAQDKKKNMSHRIHWLVQYYEQSSRKVHVELPFCTNLVCSEAEQMELLTLLTRGTTTARLPLDLPQGSPAVLEERYFDSVFLALPRAPGEAQRPVQGAMPYVTVAARARSMPCGGSAMETHLVVDRLSNKGTHGDGAVQARVLETQLMLAFAINARASTIQVPLRLRRGVNAEGAQTRLRAGDRAMLCRLGFVRSIPMDSNLATHEHAPHTGNHDEVLHLTAASFAECTYQCFGAQMLPTGPATFDHVAYADDQQKTRLYDQPPPQVTQEATSEGGTAHPPLWATVHDGPDADQTTLRYVSKLHILCAGCEETGTLPVNEFQYLRLEASDPRIQVTDTNELRLPTNVWVLAYLEGPDILRAGLRSLLPEAASRANLAGKGLVVCLPIKQAKEALRVYPDLRDTFVVVAAHRAFQIWLLPFPGEGFRLETPRSTFVRSAFGAHFTRLTAMQEGHLVSSEVLDRYRAQLKTKLEAVRAEHARFEGRGGGQEVTVDNLALAEDFITKHDFSCANSAAPKDAGTRSQCWRKGLFLGWLIGKRSLASDKDQKLAIQSCVGAFRALSNDGRRMHSTLSDGLYVREQVEDTPGEEQKVSL